MSIKTYRPTTPARRQMTVSGFDGVDKHARPEKALTEVLKKNSGRNSYGRITVRHKGGGNRQKYRVIDFKRNKLDVEATVLRLEYDPNRSAFIALVEYTDGERRYILAPVGLKAGDVVVSSANADIKAGNITFEDAAKQFSSCPSKEQGGNLGEFGRGQMVPEFDTACFSMEVGEISEPVKTQFGYHIIRLNSKGEGEAVTFDVAKEQIKQMLIGEKRQKAYQSKVNQLKILYPVERP